MMEIQNLFHKGESLADLRYKEKEWKGRSREIVELETITREEHALDWSHNLKYNTVSQKKRANFETA